MLEHQNLNLAISKKIMNEKNRKYCSKMAPANALFLWRTTYPQKYQIKYNNESILL